MKASKIHAIRIAYTKILKLKEKYKNVKIQKFTAVKRIYSTIYCLILFIKKYDNYISCNILLQS